MARIRYTWAKQVKDRDGKCAHCGTTDNLHAHHIKSRAEYPELINNLDNGMTLCYGCHRKEHERNRPTRLRSQNPHRRTIENKNRELQAEVRRLKESISYLETKIKLLEKVKGKGWVLRMHVNAEQKATMTQAAPAANIDKR